MLALNNWALDNWHLIWVYIGSALSVQIPVVNPVVLRWQISKVHISLFFFVVFFDYCISPNIWTDKPDQYYRPSQIMCFWSGLHCLLLIQHLVPEQRLILFGIQWQFWTLSFRKFAGIAGDLSLLTTLSFISCSNIHWQYCSRWNSIFFFFFFFFF